MSFSEKIKQLRESQNLSLQELAEIIGVTRSSVWKYEQEKAMPTQDILKKLAVYFDVSIDYLFFNDGERKDLPKIHDRELYELFDTIARLEPQRKKNIINAIKMMLGKE